MEVGHQWVILWLQNWWNFFKIKAEVTAHPSHYFRAEASPGDLRFVDINGDGLINASDRTNIGDPIPEATMGFNHNEL
jgi:hypothetical protein